MSRAVIINGRRYPAELYAIAREIEAGGFPGGLEALRKFMTEPPRPDVGAAVRAGIAAARALEPKPRNRRERRALAARRRAGGI